MITAPSSGTLVQWSNGIHTVANISCATGYYLEGNTQLVCDSSQTWDSELPNCCKLTKSYEPRCEKTGLRGFRPSPTQTGLYNHTIWLEA